MNVYIYAPGEVLHYSYDFRTKTRAQALADGWIESAEGTITFDSNGISSTQYRTLRNPSIPSLNLALREANIITLGTGYYMGGLSYGWYCDGGVGTNSSSGNQLGIFITHDKTDTYCSDLIDTKTYEHGAIPVGDYNVTVVLNKTAKTVTTNIPGFYNKVISVTAAQIASIENGNILYTICSRAGSAYTRRVSIDTE